MNAVCDRDGRLCRQSLCVAPISVSETFAIAEHCARFCFIHLFFNFASQNIAKAEVRQWEDVNQNNPRQ